MTSFTSIPHLESDSVRVERVLHLGRGYFCFPATMKNKHDFTLFHINMSIPDHPGMSIHYHPLSSIIIHYHPLSSIIIHYTPSKYSVHDISPSPPYFPCWAPPPDATGAALGAGFAALGAAGFAGAGAGGAGGASRASVSWWNVKNVQGNRCLMIYIYIYI